MQTAATSDLVAPRLEGAGRPVVAMLTGLEADASSLKPWRWIHTSATWLRCWSVRISGGAIFVGHSYAGMVITGVAEHARDRIAHLVYVDALVPEPEVGFGRRIRAAARAVTVGRFAVGCWYRPGCPSRRARKIRDSQRTKPRSGKSGCARLRGAVFDTRPARIAWRR